MVAKITVPGSIKRALNYNEQKVKQGIAHCLYAHHFLQEAGDLSFCEKLARFERLTALNKRAATNAVHISLNFAVEEKIAKERMIEIAVAYMEKIGFGQQPYLVYQHHDSGHPHIHIVTTNIQKDGKRISLHNIGRNQSETARREIETAFGLQQAEAQRAIGLTEMKPADVQRLVYGKSATKRGIVNVLNAVLRRYKYASLAELNAVLRLYNVTADRGKEESVLYKKRGLLYRVLDAQGNAIGVPVKASSILGKPTLDYLEQQFARNAVLRQPFKKQLKGKLDWVLVRRLVSLAAFKQALEGEKISLVIRENEAGVVYGLTYIDHHTKCVFNGSELGKAYSAKAVLEECEKSRLVSMPYPQERHPVPGDKSREVAARDQHQPVHTSSYLKALANPVEDQQHIPYELRKRSKKRRKRP